MQEGAAAGQRSDRWWEDREVDLRLGVFQGGGAKGIAYAGALGAVWQEGIWFSAVAGSSAGAITAVLVAAGFEPEELPELTAEGLSSVSRSSWRLFTGASPGLFDNRSLGAWMESRLRRRLHVAEDRPLPVTFADLYAGSGIDCYVVVLDLATGAPQVLGRDLTPDAAVVDAVLASSAIPGGLSPGRLVVNGNDRPVLHHLVDGGAWANLPTFVFRDEAWRRWALPDASEERIVATLSDPLLLFTLNGTFPASAPSQIVVAPHSNQRDPQFDLGTGRSSESVLASGVSWIFGSIQLRLLTVMAMATLALMLGGQLPEGMLDLSEWVMRRSEELSWTWVVPRLAPSVFVVVAWTVLATAICAVVTPVLMLAVGRIVAYSALPSFRALTGLATKPPPWAKETTNAMVINLPVDRQVGTTSFALRSELRQAVISQAFSDAQQALRTLPQRRVRVAEPPISPLTLRTATSVPYSRPRQRLLGLVTPIRELAQKAFGAAIRVIAWGFRWLELGRWHTGAIVAVFFAIVGALLLYAGLTHAHVGALLGAGLATILSTLVAFAGLGRAALRRANGRAPPHWYTVPGLSAIAVAAMLLAGGFGSAAETQGREATVLAVSQERDGERVYNVQVDGSGRASLSSPYSLGVGERVLLTEERSGDPRLLATAHEKEFWISGLLGAVGLGILLFGSDELWYRRFRRRLDAAIPARG